MLQKPNACPLHPQKKLWIICYLVCKTPLHTPDDRLQGMEKVQKTAQVVEGLHRR